MSDSPLSASKIDNTVIIRRSIADEFGLSQDQVTDVLLSKIAKDPVFLYHLDVCKSDPELLHGLLKNIEPVKRITIPEPTTVELIGRAGAALARWAASNFSRVGTQEYQKRISACQSCEHFSVPSTNKLFYKMAGTSPEKKSICELCGCIVQRKAWLKTEDCPDARWDVQRSTTSEDTARIEG